MIPLIVLVVVTLGARALGAFAWSALDSWTMALRVGLAAMLALTASAHFASRRADLVRMVPPALPAPELLVTVTGVAELAVAAGLLFDATAAASAVALAVLLVALFPANVHAARAGVGIGGRPATPLGLRTVMQAVFVAAAVAAAIG